MLARFKQKATQAPARLSRDPSDAALGVFFFEEAIEDEDESTKQGRPIYKIVDFVRIVIPPTQWAPTGEEYIGKVTQREINRFPQEWNHFQASKDDPVEGTPIKMWPAVNVAQVKELLGVGLQTVEQLADLTPREVSSNAWIEVLHKKAVEWVNAATDNNELLRLQARITELEQEVEGLLEDKKELIATIRNSTDGATSSKKKLNTKTVE